MNEEQPVTRSSMVPVLGCIALMLFSLSSYKIFDNEFLSKWRSTWCHTEHQHTIDVHQHNGVFAFEFDRAAADIERAHQELERTRHLRERAVRLNVERAEQKLVRLQRQLENQNDVRVHVNIERLQNELQAKANQLKDLERELDFNGTRLDWQCEMDHDHHSDLQIHVVR